ncbi:hypothetical protein S7711_01773 [Stachybotrys chartarum IBT 7711]|uniref:Helicase ATP-binding domain-containing protein n=1 Tax=Stachybotrys chartarum (strain CBS 109288 / IBT 7711) TaxID=1280523 RepID=A0A084AIX4_STACB|nr:hypothetical protein S7711_01773 [Stachybotrys chartarum IBT 7711]
MDPIDFHVRGEQLRRAAEQGSWSTSPELPTAEEIMAPKPKPIPSNPIDRPPRSKEEYLETQYRLLRHEATEPLRQAVASYRESPQMQESNQTLIYTKVFVLGYAFSRRGAACRVSFRTERSTESVVWSQCNRLKDGSVVALAPKSDGFKTKCMIGVISTLYAKNVQDASGEVKSFPEVDVYFAIQTDAIIDPNIEMVMIESTSGYYESIRHVMVGLQHASVSKYAVRMLLFAAPLFHSHSNFSDFCLDKPEIVDSVVDRPGGTQELRTRQDVAGMFDQTQHNAFERIVSRELGIVQGPPGTGKTYTSVMAIERLVQTLNQDDTSGIVVIAAQTNHAVDQLLEICIQRNIGKIVRLGGRSTVECLQDRSMYNLRQRSNMKRGNGGAERRRKATITRFQETLRSAFPKELVSPDELYVKRIITQDQLESLTQSDWEGDTSEVEDHMARWLEHPQGEDATVPLRKKECSEAVEVLTNKAVDSQADEDEKERVMMVDFIPLTSAETSPSRRALGDSPAGVAWLHQAKHLLESTQDLYDIKASQRSMVYRYFQKRLLDNFTLAVPAILNDYQRVCDDLKITQWKNNVEVLCRENITIIGCTTTGLTKYRGLLAAAKPRVLLIEEAAETREANITSALVPSLEQVALIGDHQQLAPHVDVRLLALPPYHLDVSLVERLIRLGLPYAQLGVQRRMASNLRKVVQVFYPNLQDHESVKSLPPVRGMGNHNLWWFQHTWPESRDSRLSWYNSAEAEMIVGFVQHLVLSGCDLTQITILTYYTGQVQCIKDKLQTLGILSCEEDEPGCLVRTVDGYQGEENDIVILSLVRSPQNLEDRANAGFVEVENRAVVALSRAKHGLYVFGDASNLLRSSTKSHETWKKVFSEIERQGCTGFYIPVSCDDVKEIMVGDSNGWEAVSYGENAKPILEIVHEERARQHGNALEHSKTVAPPRAKPKPRKNKVVLRQNEGMSTLPGPGYLLSLGSRSQHSGDSRDAYRSSEDLMERGYFYGIDKSKVLEIPPRVEERSNDTGCPLIILDFPDDDSAHGVTTSSPTKNSTPESLLTDNLISLEDDTDNKTMGFSAQLRQPRQGSRKAQIQDAASGLYPFDWESDWVGKIGLSLV